MSFDFHQSFKRIENTLNTFEPISLKGLDNVKMLNRIDTKFVFHINDFPTILEEIREQYFVLEIEGKRIFAYESLYFDTDDYLLYKFHHNGKINRLKIRYRKYADSGLVYFEVKYKVKGNRTEKKRIQEDHIKTELTDKEFEIIHHHQLDNLLLRQKMWINFYRVTLASINLNERLTLDIHVNFDNFSASRSFPELIIAEVKTEKSAVHSPIIRSFKNRHFEEVGFSKYATGVALLENIKNNAFKPNFIKINKIIHGNC